MISEMTLGRADGCTADLVVGHDKARALLDLGVGYGLILAALWSPNPWREGLSLVTLGWIALASWRSFTGWRAMGLGRGGLLRSAWLVGVALVVVVSALLFADRLGTLHVPHGLVLLIRSFWGYALWSLLQQFMLQDFFLRRLLEVLPSRRGAVGAAAVLFAVAHLPNPVLTAMTLVWGVVACLIFLRYRNLFTVGMIHAVLGVCVAVTVPGPMQHDMRVGLGYLRYRPHGLAAPGRIDRAMSAKTRGSGMGGF